MRSRRSLVLVALLAVLTILSGCGLFRAKSNIDLLETIVELQGEVTGAARNHVVIVALIRDSDGKKQVFNYSLQYGSGPFHFRTTPGAAYLFAFEDVNGNQHYEKGEPASWYGGNAPKKITLNAGEKASNLQIALATGIPEGVDEVIRPQRDSENAIRLGKVKYSVGEVTSLNDRRFTAERGSQGLFEPVQSAVENGMGIYMLQPYDPKKVPVLFVHGAGGYPREFKPIIEQMDRTRFQPWVFQYQSGLRLDMSSDILKQILVQLYTMYKLDKLAIVAHSMGGLVSRAAVNKIDSQYPNNPIRLFITLSTPWNGVDSARLGVEYSPIVVQSWVDVAPGSPFLAKLFEQPLSKSITYYQLFGVIGGDGTDGAVPLTSVASLRAQADAARLYAYPATHAGILRNEEAIKRVNMLLETTF
jgi:uncharacterized alpha/beta hydrolase family protein